MSKFPIYIPNSLLCEQPQVILLRNIIMIKPYDSCLFCTKQTVAQTRNHSLSLFTLYTAQINHRGRTSLVCDNIVKPVSLKNGRIRAMITMKCEGKPNHYFDTLGAPGPNHCFDTRYYHCFNYLGVIVFSEDTNMLGGGAKPLIYIKSDFVWTP